MDGRDELFQGMFEISSLAYNIEANHSFWQSYSLKGLSQSSLFMRCMQAGDFLEPMSKPSRPFEPLFSTLECLETIKVSFSARFEFPQPSNGPPMHRLDVMLSEECGTIETEAARHYWLEPPASRTTPESLFHLHMIEFERYDLSDINLTSLYP